MNTPQFVQRTLIVLALIVLLLALWKLAGLLLLVFGAVIFAIVIRAGGDLLAAHSPVTPRWGSLIVVLLVLGLLVGLGFVFGGDIAKQLAEVRESLPKALENAREWLRGNEFGRSLLATMNSGSVSAADAFRTTSATFGVFADLLLLLLLALYLAFHPGRYRDGVIALVPDAHQSTADDALRTSGNALRGWLLGQLVSMVAVGTLTGIGLWIAGVPLALILGLIAGLLNFVPVIGPLAAAVPGILLAFAVGPTTAAYAALVYFIVQQLEGAVIMPMAQRWSVDLPPALGLISIVVFGVLFGIPGILFATPLTVVLMALVKHFYLHDANERGNRAEQSQ